MLEAHAAILAFETAGFIISVAAVVARASASKRRTIRPVPAPYPRALLALRIFATIVLLAALIRHALLVGLRAARKFTVWNALLLTAYFSSCLMPALSAAVPDDDDDDDDDGETALLVPTVFDRAAWPLPALHPPLLSLCLSNQLALSACTWLLLYPAVPPEQQQHLLGAHSLVEHGGGALLAAIELLLLRQPIPTNAGAVALLLFAFGLWHEVWHAATSEVMYPFLDYDEPTAPLMYAALVVAYVATNLAVCRLSRCAKSAPPPPPSALDVSAFASVDAPAKASPKVEPPAAGLPRVASGARLTEGRLSSVYTL